MQIKSKTIAHSCRVADICNEFVDELEYELEYAEEGRRILTYSAFLHDIFKEEDDDEHHNMAADWVKEHSGIKNSDCKQIADIIRCHKGKFAPKEENWELAAIFRLSDKLDKYNKGKKDAKRKCKKSRKKIGEWCKKRNNTKETFDKICEVMEEIEKGLN